MVARREAGVKVVVETVEPTQVIEELLRAVVMLGKVGKVVVVKMEVGKVVKTMEIGKVATTKQLWEHWVMVGRNMQMARMKLGIKKAPLARGEAVAKVVVASAVAAAAGKVMVNEIGGPCDRQAEMDKQTNRRFLGVILSNLL